MNRYKRLNIEDREEISRLLLTGLSFRSIAKSLGRAPSTISREVGRPRAGRSNYRAIFGQKVSQSRASSRKSGKRKLFLRPKLFKVVSSKLKIKWSPRQIAEYLKLQYEEADMQISAESIYTYIYIFLRKPLRKEFTKELRLAHKKRRKKGQSQKGQVNTLKNMVLIDERPEEVHDRLVPGHWEGDLMIGGGRKQSAMGTLVERRTRYAILVRLKNKTAKEVRKEFAKEVKKLPKYLRLTLTYDQGREMAEHRLFTKETKMKVYFAHPQSPWERGTNENTNGLLRQYFPKGTDFTKITRAQMKKVQRELNDRPRATLGYRSPYEKMTELLR